MKNIISSLLVISTVFNGSCSSQKKIQIDQNKSVANNQKNIVEKIELTEQTRGTDRKITYTPLYIITSLNGKSSSLEMSFDGWKNIVKQANSVNLSEIASYQAPTSGRFSDRALSSTISIISKGKTYQSAEFDAGAPPKELEALYQTLKK
ncbi:hypothetical protein [Chryseobacterium paridis]|uniref:Lipoprotein n=1 Tax=Chryseobacterium paridis TaxID=2800328 RepID=A0ABS1G0C0_9FLAO|nr:hypothetical protein [Chryseobacterium paridis]MBK1898131.1 hypothetical protein [Chryseobacterium paridis]